MAEMSGLGWLVVDTVEIPITHLELAGGKIHFHGYLAGPTEPIDGPIAIRGHDGYLVSVAGGRVQVAAVEADLGISIHYDLNITYVSKESGRVTDPRTST